MPTIRIPAPLRGITDNKEEVILSGANLEQVLTKLCDAYPGLFERILDQQGEIRRFVNIFVNDEDVRFLQERQTPLNESDVISILPASAGG